MTRTVNAMLRAAVEGETITDDELRNWPMLEDFTISSGPSRWNTCEDSEVPAFTKALIDLRVRARTLRPPEPQIETADVTEVRK